LYASHSLAHGCQLPELTISSGPSIIATIGFHNQLIIENICFFFFLYAHFATNQAAILAFFVKSNSGFITI